MNKSMDGMASEKTEVRQFWEDAACGEDLYLHGLDQKAYDDHSFNRYALEPYILDFARFDEARGMRALEIGVGLGADHQRFAESGAFLHGIDLTERAVEHTRRRLALSGLASQLAVGDAENLHFRDDSFDMVYSWGVLHHSPDTPKAISEVHRILKPGGKAKVMIYNKWSLVGLMLWVRYALMTLKPWLSLTAIYARHLESPGTKAYSVGEARRMFYAFRDVRVKTVLSHADLLESAAGQRHKGMVLTLARRIMPRSLMRRFFPDLGLVMLIEATK